MKILLLGAQGQLGWELQRSLSVVGEVIACSRHAGGAHQADLAEPESLVDLVRRWQPAAIVNAAAYTAVDKAESEPEVARRVNALAPGVLAREAAALGAPLVHYSTDYVFDGSGSQPRDEDASTAPLNIYGATKLEGEALIRESGCCHLILRTSWVYAARGGNFVRTMLRLAAEREELQVICDQIGAPTGADLLADVTAQALPRLLTDATLAGTYHCAAGGETSWYGYACFVIEWARRHGQTLRVPANGVVAIPTRDYPTPARRPLNSRLDTTRLRSKFGLSLPDWKQGVERMLQEIHGR
jgi:dTDP-4-dehydrorhamnose reductase